MTIYSNHIKCGHKVRYDSQTLAGGAVRAHRKRHRNDSHMEAYNCIYCDGWHIGHSGWHSSRNPKKGRKKS